jgi:non-lysosomal glucosylceramidase
LPSYEMKQEWTQWPNFRGGAVCMDGEMGTVLKTYR